MTQGDAVPAHRMHRRVPFMLLAVASLAACSSGGGSSTPAGTVTAVDEGGVQMATITGTDGLRFSPGTVKAKPGIIAITLKVTGGVPHNISVKGVPDAAIANVGAHQEKTMKFTATAGTYELICSFHSGMRGSLVVAP